MLEATNKKLTNPNLVELYTPVELLSRMPDQGHHGLLFPGKKESKIWHTTQGKKKKKKTAREACMQQIKKGREPPTKPHAKHVQNYSMLTGTPS